MGGYVADPMGVGNSTDERKADQATKAGIGIVTAINPIVGGGLALGSAIGSTTMDDNGIYKSKSGEIIDNNINPVTGVRNVLDLAKHPDGSSLLNLASGGMFGSNRRQREKEAALEKQRQDNLNKFNSFITDRSNSILADYDVYGNKEEASLYQMGGKLKPLNSDTVEVKGPSHAEGGVKIGGGTELEGNETVADDFVFSDYLGFADKHKKLAKQIGVVEKKPLNNERRVTLEILRKKEQALKEQQEQTKQSLGIPSSDTYQMGGRLMDLTTGEAYTEPEGTPPYTVAGGFTKVERDFSKEPFTLDEWRYKSDAIDRDYNKYPITADEIKGWTQSLKDRDLAYQREAVRQYGTKLDLSKHWANFKSNGSRKTK